MTIILHHLNQSRSQRVLFVLEELGLPYELRAYRRDRRTGLAPAALKAIHPLGKSPVLQDGDAIFAETGAIIEHLIHRGGATALAPEAGTDAARDCAYFLHYAEGSLLPALTVGIGLGFLLARLPQPLRAIGGAADRALHPCLWGRMEAPHLAMIEAILRTRPWLAGEALSGADAIMTFPLQALRWRYGLARNPAIADWLERIEARPAWQRAVDRGGALTFAI